MRRVRRPREDGFVTVQFTVATALTLVLVTVVAQLVVHQYARGVVRAALDEGVRAGSRAGPDGAARCDEAVTRTLSDLLGGTLGDRIDVAPCTEGPDVIEAAAVADLPSWTPLTPGWRFEVRASAVRERDP